MKLLAPAIVLLLTSLGCSRDTDKESPVIEIKSPVAGKVYENGDPILIQGTVSDDRIVNELMIYVTHAYSGSVIIAFVSNPGTKEVSFNHSVEASSGIDYRVQVIAKDKSMNDARKQVQFTCN